MYINRVDSKVFYRRDRARNDGKLIVMFPGGLQWHQGLDIAIRAFAKIPAKLPQAEFHIYGDGNMKDQLVALVKELGLTEKIQNFFRPAAGIPNRAGDGRRRPGRGAQAR